MSATLDLTRALIDLPSVTPDDAGCQQLLADRLEPQGFDVEWLPFGEVSNVLFTHGQTRDGNGPSLWFLGHTDVVPTGPLEDWTSPPFNSEVRDDVLYGRGAADMKGAVAAMVTAAEALVRGHPEHIGQIGILLTSDEEGDAVDGVARVADILRQRNSVPMYCLVGEPSSKDKLGDTVRIGRRGSSHARLQVHGVQGHSAFPEALDNPIHRLANFIDALTKYEWDQGDENFPPTHCQVTNIHAGTGAENVTPGHAEAWFNFRNSPASPSKDIQAKVEELLHQCGIDQYQISWQVSGEPFRSKAGELRMAVIEAIREKLEMEPELNTGGGTSDGRFIAPLGTEVLEFGLLNESIHKVDENTSIADLDALSLVYERIMIRILSGR
ncbi:MAG: succinyl-diaminopimelate desuccinylase [Gammaproteobacteria bacterium]|nr:succinyl-diaminopimelate desuccinylase [Gammaproteobacteria bacterium]